MSPDWPLAALVAIGHAGVVVYLTNVIHAAGLTKRRAEALKLALLATVLLLTWLLARELTRSSWDHWSWGVRLYALVCLATSLVGIPVASLWLHWRGTPEGIAERASEVDLAAVHGADALVGHGRHSWLLKIPGNESLRLRKREWDVAVAGLPAVWDGLSVVHLTDLHFSRAYRRRFFDLVADEAAAWEADLVVFTGDLVDHDDALDWIVPVLSRVAGRLGSFAILGNHDYNHDHARVRRLLVEAGYADLEGCWSRLDLEGGSIALGGTSFPWGPRLDFDAMPPADFRVLLSHSPDLFYRAAAVGIDLMLSGHNHGGQVRVPGLGPIFMPSRYSRRFDRGYFRAGRTLLHVGEGVGGLHPIRFGCVPEVSRLVLRAGRELNSSVSSARASRATLSR